MTPLAPIASLSLAKRAYATGTSNASAPSAIGGGDDSGSGFGAMVSNFARSQINTLRSSERTMAQGVAGKIDPQSMVEAASNAQITVQSMVAVLSKATSAYNDVMHMSA